MRSIPPELNTAGMERVGAGNRTLYGWKLECCQAGSGHNNGDLNQEEVGNYVLNNIMIINYNELIDNPSAIIIMN